MPMEMTYRTSKHQVAFEETSCGGLLEMNHPFVVNPSSHPGLLPLPDLPLLPATSSSFLASMDTLLANVWTRMMTARLRRMIT